MLITDVVSLAKYSELAGVAAKSNDDAIVAFINLGLIELYGRFPLKVEEVVISLVDNETYYAVPSNFLYPLQAFGEASEDSPDDAIPISINNSDDPLSIYFNDWKTVQIPAAIDGAYVSIIYVAKPDPITKAESLDGVTEIQLPDSLIDCLLSYVGYRAHLGVKSDSRSENNAHWQRFERNCNKAQELGVAYPIEELNTSMRLGNRGFV